jgi:peptidoglycan/LPS O-acetylase OafA/YrhL
MLFRMGGILELFPIWLLGATLARIPLIPVTDRLRFPIWFLYLLLFFALSKLSANWSLTGDYLLGLATFVFIASLLNKTGRAPETVWVRLARTSARFSYTLYLAHFPFLVLLAAFIIADSRWQLSPASVAAGAAVVAVTLLYAYAVAYVTEFRTDTVRGWIEGIVLTGRRPAPARSEETLR